MNSSLIQLLVLAGIAIFLILKLKSVLGTRDGFEKPSLPPKDEPIRARKGFEVIEGGPDRDIADHTTEGSPAAKALTAMKAAEPSFNVSEFLGGARGAYEMIVMAFESGDLASVKAFLAPDVYETFEEAVRAREDQGLTVEAKFIGIRELTLHDASFDPTTREGEVAVRFVGELTSVVRDKMGEIVEGGTSQIKRQRDVWTFARQMGSNDPNWLLVATGD
ncbi:MAG: Tim44/TimA family putative adaptor protein [Pseudorhodobacter sp.]|jgi:predicted lipid-binding transport protein (Tim44 family)|nr:Tim44/TimA family putative adaptor protein [Pseudorhodobacter sp.]